MTRDGVPIVIHGEKPNNHLTVVYGKEVFAKDLGVENACAIQIGEGETVPTLLSVIEWAKESKIELNIEIKEKDERIVPIVCDMVRKLDAENFCHFSSFEEHIRTALRKELKEYVEVAWLYHRHGKEVRRLSRPHKRQNYAFSFGYV